MSYFAIFLGSLQADIGASPAIHVARPAIVRAIRTMVQGRPVCAEASAWSVAGGPNAMGAILLTDRWATLSGDATLPGLRHLRLTPKGRRALAHSLCSRVRDAATVAVPVGTTLLLKVGAATGPVSRPSVRFTYAIVPNAAGRRLRVRTDAGLFPSAVSSDFLDSAGRHSALATLVCDSDTCRVVRISP